MRKIRSALFGSKQEERGLLSGSASQKNYGGKSSADKATVVEDKPWSRRMFGSSSK